MRRGAAGQLLVGAMQAMLRGAHQLVVPLLGRALLLPAVGPIPDHRAEDEDDDDRPDNDHVVSLQQIGATSFLSGVGLMIATQQLIAPDMLRRYGTTAQARSPHDQLVAAHRLYLRYGWEPWPNTSRMSGPA